jgi:hypothetical protein
MRGWLNRRVAFAAVAMALAAWPGAAMAQAQAAHFLGTVTAINGDTLTIKPATGDERQVQVPSTADLKRIEPGQTSLSGAASMQFSEIASGDRVLVWVDPNSTSGTPKALRVVAIKAADLAKKREEEQQEWRVNGVGGLVKSTDPATGTIMIAAGAGSTLRTITVHTGKSTILKRYAPASISYAAAQPAPFDAIHAGDELMARGDKNSGGTEVAAAEVVSGSFRNVSGLIVSLDPAGSTFVVKDLATKKPVTVAVPADAEMRELPERMAQFLAVRLKGAAAVGGSGRGRPQGGAPGNFRQGSGVAGNAGGVGAMSSQQILSRAPAIHFADLKKGQAVMLVATPGNSQVTAITLVAGVEPLLEAPASQDLLSNWSMGSSVPQDATSEGAGDASTP